MGKTNKEKTIAPARSPRPLRRVVQTTNRLFLDRKVSTKVQKRNQKTNNQRNDATQPNTSLDNSPTVRIPPTPCIVKEPDGHNIRKSKKFIRFRFQVDWSTANDFNVDELVLFLKNNIKVDGKRCILDEVSIERRNTAYIHILAKVDLKKKYLKQLSKIFLKKKKLRNYRVIVKNKRAYKIVLKD